MPIALSPPGRPALELHHLLLDVNGTLDSITRALGIAATRVGAGDGAALVATLRR